MISRRSLIGALVGIPFAAKAALGVSPKIGDITVTGISGFDTQRIEDIGDAFLLSMEHSMDSKGIRFTEIIDPDWPATWGTGFIIAASEYAEKSILHIQRVWAAPALEGLLGELQKHQDSKCRYYGVDIFRCPEGLLIQMAYSHDETNPTRSAVDAVYSKWLRTLA